MYLLLNCEGVEITVGPLKATARLMWPPVRMSLTPLQYLKRLWVCLYFLLFSWFLFILSYFLICLVIFIECRKLHIF